MIAKNLGKPERIVRLLLGVLVAVLTAMQPEFGAFEGLTSVIALFLVLNGIFGRCYLWHLLEISSCGCNQVPQERFCNKRTA